MFLSGYICEGSQLQPSNPPTLAYQNRVTGGYTRTMNYKDEYIDFFTHQ